LAVKTESHRGVVLIRKEVGDAREGLPEESSKARKRLEQMGAFAAKAHRLTKASPLSVNIDLSSDGEYVVWVKYGLAKRVGSAAIRIAVAGERAHLGWALRLVGSGHSSNMKYNASAFVWEAGQTGVGRYNHTHVFKLKKGPVKIALQVDSDSELDVAGVVLTPDLGFQPKGIHCYRPGNPEWLGD